MKSAVLLIIFNRPETTKQVFEKIREARPPKLYIAGDGYRPHKENEEALCKEAQLIATNVDWPCEVRTLFRDENLGCKYGPARAIDWFFENEEEGIILEDDILPLPAFFDFCDELLERYRENPKVMMISGCNLISKRFCPIESYFFVKHTHIWGWATWRRSWKFFDIEMTKWPEWKTSGSLEKKADSNSIVDSAWTNIFDYSYQNKIDAWDYQWTFACWQANGLSALSEVNLIQNIGFGIDATHTKSEKPKCVVESVPKDINFPLIHPKSIHQNLIADRIIEKFVYGIERK